MKLKILLCYVRLQINIDACRKVRTHHGLWINLFNKVFTIKLFISINILIAVIIHKNTRKNCSKGYINKICLVFSIYLFHWISSTDKNFIENSTY